MGMGAYAFALGANTGEGACVHPHPCQLLSSPPLATYARLTAARHLSDTHHAGYFGGAGTGIAGWLKGETQTLEFRDGTSWTCECSAPVLCFPGPAWRASFSCAA